MSKKKDTEKEQEFLEQEDINQENVSTETVEEELQAALQTEKEKFLRLFAEFENYKKRTSKERVELFKTANEELMTVLLPIIDDFDRGLSEIKKAEDKELLKGMELIYNKLTNSLSQKGLAEVEVAQGDAFDAETHEAVTQIPAPSNELKGKIIDVLEKGYKLGEKIIRYPKVVVGQ
ncbi:MAG TPA: nucleotide exchange factor GrpE [Flavobacteriaceae bacterium]|nr:nucleotide exchange factor GrpE [Flavobacteriaceae bacterium]